MSTITLEVPDDLQLCTLQFNSYFRTWTCYVIPVDNSSLRGFVSGYSRVASADPADALTDAIRDYREKEHLHNSGVHFGTRSSPTSILDIF